MKNYVSIRPLDMVAEEVISPSFNQRIRIVQPTTPPPQLFMIIASICKLLDNHQI